MVLRNTCRRLARLASAVAMLPLIPLSMSSAQAQIINMPSVPMTVSDCRPGYHWEVYGGITRCRPDLPPDTCANHGLYAWDQGGGSTWIGGVGTCYYPYTPPPPPPPPRCQYSLWSTPLYYLVIEPNFGQYGDGGGGGGGVTYAVYWGQSSRTPTIHGYNPGGDLTFAYNAAIAWVDSQITAQGYSRGGLQNSTPSDGNYAGTEYYVVCH